MNDASVPLSIVAAQVQRLLDVVADYEQQQRQQIMAAAQQQARAIIRQAHAQARRQLHAEAVDSRERMRRELAREQARHQTAIKQQQHSADQQFLQQAWQQLHAGLLQRWQQPALRAAWLANILNVAAHTLPVCSWRISLAAGCSHDDLQQIAGRALLATGMEATLLADDALTAGLHVAAQDALVDGSVAGLLQNRDDIAARLLAAYYRRESAAP